MASKRSSSKKGLSNFGNKRAVPYGQKGGGHVPKGGYKPRTQGQRRAD